MTWAAWDISNAVWRASEAADANGWEAHDVTPDCACFIKGDHHIVIHIAVNGGIVVIFTDQGSYKGHDRAGWAVRYIEENS